MRTSVRTLTLSGLLGAVAIVLGMTRIGFIPVPGPAAYATIMHLPVILGAIVGGPVVGVAVGLIFGLYSLTLGGLPPDPLVILLPRLLIGLTAAYSYRGLQRVGSTPALAVAAVVGTLTNTGGVLGMAVLRSYMTAEQAWVVAATNGLAEVILAALLTVPVGLALQRAGLMAKAPKSDPVG